MNKDAGLGEVIMKNKLINVDSVCSGMTAVKHGNGRDWWLIVKGNSANPDSSFFRYLIRADTIISSKVSIGSNSNTNLGSLSFSMHGNHMAYVSFPGLIETFDFDRCTGEFSNAKVIRPQCIPNCALYFGASYSASGNVLYVSSSDHISRLYQFNLLSPDPWASRETLAVLNTPDYAGGGLKRGPDDKIYWSCGWTTPGVWPYPYQDSMYHTENMNL